MEPSVTQEHSLQKSHTIHVTQPFVANRIDHFLCSQFPNHSRSFFHNLLAQNCVYQNDLVAKKNNKLKLHDTVTITFPEIKTHNAQQHVDYNFNVSVVHQDEHFYVIHKPAGLVVHPPSVKNLDPSLTDWIVLNVPAIASVGIPERPGIVHRLDKDTSGIMLIARSSHGHTQFTNMFKNRIIHKTYLAIVHGHPPKQGSIDLPIGRHPIHRTKMATYTSEHLTNPHVRTALTNYKVLKYFEDYSLLELKPITGRTHQIRVHCAAIGHPLVGDAVYGKKSKLINRHALHAKELAFVFDGKPNIHSHQIPEDLQNLLTHLQTS